MTKKFVKLKRLNFKANIKLQFDQKNEILPVEHPEEFESESVHSTGRGNEKSVHSCLRSDLT